MKHITVYLANGGAKLVHSEEPSGIDPVENTLIIHPIDGGLVKFHMRYVLYVHETEEDL